MSNSKENFYIGYLPKAPQPLRRFLLQFVGISTPIILLIAVLLVRNQGNYSSATFELGQSTTLEGTLTFQPVPMLKMALGKDIHGEQQYKSVLLIDFGKFGAEKSFKKINPNLSELEGSKVQLEGTLIYHNGKTLLELSKMEQSILEIQKASPLSQSPKSLGSLEAIGEIADPKCYFGVMKPGEGKPHRSCAVRCISGGIPPIFKTQLANHTEYYILVGENGQAINKEILPLVGRPIELQGEVEQLHDWKILKVKTSSVQPYYSLSTNPPMCGAKENTTFAAR